MSEPTAPTAPDEQPAPGEQPAPDPSNTPIHRLVTDLDPDDDDQARQRIAMVDTQQPDQLEQTPGE